MVSLIAKHADITRLKADAIVNAANRFLFAGGGVDGAIHHAAGPELDRECRTLHGCKTGEAKITKGYKLPAKFIIHTVGPTYGTGGARVARLLGQCYENSLKLAVKNKVKSIAFPNIATGAFGYPIVEAAPIAIAAVKEFLAKHKNSIEKVYFVSYTESDNEVYRKLLKK